MPVSRPHDYALLTIGAACAAGGLYFMLVGFDLAPSPSKINGPLWLAICVGLVFLAGGAMVLVRADRANDLRRPPVLVQGFAERYIQHATPFGTEDWIDNGALADMGNLAVIVSR